MQRERERERGGGREREREGERFLVRSWLVRLWRQASPRICRVSWEAGALAELVV